VCHRLSLLISLATERERGVKCSPDSAPHTVPYRTRALVPLAIPATACGNPAFALASASSSSKKTCDVGEEEIYSSNSLRVVVSNMINQLVQQLGSQVSLVLASSSPRRLEILGIIGLKPEARAMRHERLHCRAIA
jgi:hypothetical protein